MVTKFEMRSGRILQRSWLHVLVSSAILALPSAVLFGSSTNAGPNSPSHSIGLVLTMWDSAFLETPNAQDECPQGLQYSEKDQWLALSEEERGILNKRFGFRWNRGPNGENGITAPAAVRDSLPFREVQSKAGYGFNLDGTQDGHATGKSCAHQKFISPDGRDSVDHQLYRVLGCSQGMRKGGFQREWVAQEIQTQPVNRILIEVVGVDSERNDDNVQVRFYKGFDGLPSGSNGKVLPDATQRVDARFPLLFSAEGKIVDGVLSLEPVPLGRFPIKWIQAVGMRNIRDMRMRLEFTEIGAEGIIGGYEDIDEHWNMWRRGASGSQDIDSWSGASIYKAMRRLADGYPDPQTGQCTAISAAYRVEAVRANMVLSHDEQSVRNGVTQAAQHELTGY